MIHAQQREKKDNCQIREAEQDKTGITCLSFIQIGTNLTRDCWMGGLRLKILG